MPPVLKSLSSFLLAALLLTLTTVGGMGGLAHCAGDGANHHHHPCCLESRHQEVAGHDQHPEADRGVTPAGSLPDCGCPDQHQHPVASFDLIPLVRLHPSTPVWIETSIDPAPPDFSLRHQSACRVPILQERIPPANPPPHLTCGPMLI